MPVEPVIKKRGKSKLYDFKKVVGDEIDKRRNLMGSLKLTEQKLVDKQYEIIEKNNEPDYSNEAEDKIMGRNLKA